MAEMKHDAAKAEAAEAILGLVFSLDQLSISILS